jgi:hypothetical protein
VGQERRGEGFYRRKDLDEGLNIRAENGEGSVDHPGVRRVRPSLLERDDKWGQLVSGWRLG